MPVTDSREFTIALRVPPDLKIVTLNYPPSADPGDPVDITWRVHNQGQDTYYPQWFRLIDLDTGEELRRLDFGLANCASVGLTWTLTMPNRKWRLKAETGYKETPTAKAEFLISLPIPAAEWLPTAIGASVPLLVVGVVVGAQEIRKTLRL